MGWQEDDVLHTKEVYRFPNGVREEKGHLTWDVRKLFSNVVTGIMEAFKAYPEIESLSIDTWGVDYVLLKGDQEVYPVYAYRDGRTEAVIPQVHEQVPFSELYRHTGCQFQPFNTIYQLYDEKVNGRLDGVTELLMMPEFLLWKLCGVKAQEYTNATTMGMVNAQTGEFDLGIVDALGYPRHLFPKLSQPGTVLGMLRLWAETAKWFFAQPMIQALRLRVSPWRVTILTFPPVPGACWVSKHPNPLQGKIAWQPTTPTRVVWAITAIRRTLWVCGW